MCLVISRKDQMKIAQEDIPCVKLLTVDENGEYRSPYMQTVYILGLEKTAEIGKKVKCFARWPAVAINEGLHSFDVNAEIDILITELETSYPTNNVVKLDAIIPKGAEYYEGKFFIDGKAYVSNRLIVNKPSK